MNDTKKELIKTLLNSSGKTGPTMTHTISELGNGNMADGLVTLYRSGQFNGMIIGAGIMTALVVIHKVGKAIMEGVQTQKVIRQTCQEEMKPYSPRVPVSDISDAQLNDEILDSAIINSCDGDTSSVTDLNNT